MHLLAAKRWRSQGRPVPDDIERAERHAALLVLAAVVVLRRVRDALEGPVMIFKGPEIAAHYPDPTARPYGDLDIIVTDPAAAHRALLAAGFAAVGKPYDYYADLHHVQPLRLPEIPLAVELHRYPSWPYWSAPPSSDELFESAAPASVGVDGMLAPAASHHALMVAAHSWAEMPLRRLLDLVDVAALAENEDQSELMGLSERWGVGGIWRTTAAAVAAMFFGERTPWSLRLWARHLIEVRDPTVLENHISRWVGNWWSLPPHRAARVSGWMLLRDVLPAHEEEWGPKLMRIRRAARNAFTGRSQHDSELGEHARKFPRVPRS